MCDLCDLCICIPIGRIRNIAQPEQKVSPGNEETINDKYIIDKHNLNASYVICVTCVYVYQSGVFEILRTLNKN